ncbi:hypothetical protein [Paenibacillus polymyxa]|uniref:hypothetical protein n=1 Tax=Paenibacillus polymyxa TaxID=1406 RepID=UPI003217E1C7
MDYKSFLGKGIYIQGENGELSLVGKNNPLPVAGISGGGLRTLNGCLLRAGSVSSGIDYWYEPAIVAVSKEKVPAIEVIGGFDTRIALDLDL